MKKIQIPTVVIPGKYDTMGQPIWSQLPKQAPHGERATANGSRMNMHDDRTAYCFAS